MGVHYFLGSVIGAQALGEKEVLVVVVVSEAMQATDSTQVLALCQAEGLTLVQCSVNQ